MKKSIFLFFAAILCASSVWGANAELKNGQILYCTVNNSNWKTWSIKFNWYWNEGDWCCNDKGTKLATDIWYAKIPNDYTRAVQLIRCKGDFSEEWNWSNTVKASSRSDNYQNCVIITGSNWDNAAVSWNTYAPAMSKVTLEDNGTSIVSGSGTQADPYLVYTESTITVKATGTKSVEDPDAKVNYDFKQGTTSKQNSTTPTYQFAASATIGTTYTINVDGYTKVNTTSSTKKAATALYYKTVEPAEETHDVTLNCKYGETILQTSPITKVGVSTSTPVSVPEITGYDFVNWQLGDGIATTDAATANPIHITTNSTGDYTLTAYYKPETIYFVNTDEWETVNVYAWAGSGASEIKNAEWPGEKLLTPVDNIGGYDVYAFTSGAGYEKVIFNNGEGANKTDDLTWTADKYYVYYGQTSKDPNDWYTKDAVEGALPDWLATNVYLAGSMTDWGTNQIEFRKSAKSDYAAYLTVDLSDSKDYELKIVRGGEWTSYKDAEIKDNVDYLQFSSSVNDNCKMKTKDAGTYVFVWYINDSKLSVWYPSEYTVVGTDVLLGENWGDGLDNLDNKMVKQGDNSYKLVKEDVVLPANTYEWQIARNGDWWSSNKKVNPDDNNKLPIATAGKYNVTFTLAADLQSATATAEFIEAVDEVAKCYVTGNTTLTGHDWGVHDELEMDYDKTTETYTYTLQSLTTEKDYEFKIVCGGTWFDYSALTSPIPTGVTEGNDHSIAFKMADAGDVVVTYNIENGITLTGNFAEPVTYDYYIAGTLAGGWSATQQGMEKDDDVYKHTFFELSSGIYEFKITDGQFNTEEDKTHEHTTLGAEYKEVIYEEGNIQIITDEAINLTVIFNAATDKITFEGLTEIVPKYYLVGTFNAWNPADLNYEMTLDGGVYKKEVTLAKDDQFKVCNGSWDASWGKNNLGGIQYNELTEQDDNIKMKEAKTFTVIFNPAENLILFEGLTEKVTYVLMGVNGDWDNGIELTPNPKKAGEYMLLAQTIAKATDAVKIVKIEGGNKTQYCQFENVKDGSVACTEGTHKNIVLEDGIYNFYYTINDNKVYIQVSTPALTRTIPVGYYATVCLPNDIIKVVGATLFEVAGKDGDRVIFDEVITPVAGMPYIFLTEENQISFYCGIETAATPGYHKSLHGTFENMTDAELDGMYMVQNNKIVKCAATGCSIPANRAYFNGGELETLGAAPALMPGRRRIAMGAESENEATGTEDIITPSVQFTKKIVDGQLIIIRDGVKYNAQGQKL